VTLKPQVLYRQNGCSDKLIKESNIMIFLVSLVTFTISLILTIESGDSAHLFLDTAFPTIFAFVFIPACLLAFASLPADSREHGIKYLVSSILLRTKSNNIAEQFFLRFGNLALLQGLIVFIINLMSLFSHLTSETFESFWGVGLAHALMSVLIGLCIQIVCKTLVFRLS
jgi:hypothetical protein